MSSTGPRRPPGRTASTPPGYTAAIPDPPRSSPGEAPRCAGGSEPIIGWRAFPPEMRLQVESFRDIGFA